MAKNSMGYPLPDGDAFTDDLECLMVFYPNKPEYRQAFFGAYFYLSNWLAWERDTNKRGKDAARAWKLAVEATLECIEMGTCESILDLLTLVEENTRQCWCAVGNDPTDGQNDTDEVEDGVGDVPQNIIDAGYATGVTDWTGFDDYKCIVAHEMVNLLEQTIRDIIPHMSDSGKIIGGIGVVVAVLGAILLTGGTFVLALGVITATGVSAALWGLFNEITKAGMETLADDVSDNHDALACAIYNADGSSDAISDLEDKIDELFDPIDAAILKNLNVGPRLRALYAGRYDQQDVAQNMADAGLDAGDYDCSCVGPPPPLTSGANMELVVIDAADGYGDWDTLKFTVNTIDLDPVTGVTINVTQHEVGGFYFYVELDLAASVYHDYGDVEFRGLTYKHLTDTAGGTGYNVETITGTNAVHVAPQVGSTHNKSWWYGMHSEPYAGFQAECETILGISYNTYSGTQGLALTPNVTRKLYIRFQIAYVGTYNIKVPALYWAINYTG